MPSILKFRILLMIFCLVGGRSRSRLTLRRKKGRSVWFLLLTSNRFASPGTALVHRQLTIHQAEHKSTVKAVYDYEATAPGELSVKEDEVLWVFDTEEDWLLVQAQDGERAGFVPGNYVEAFSDEPVAPSHRIIVPPSVRRSRLFCSAD